MKLLARRAGALIVTLLFGGMLTVVMVQFSPGSDVDERELDPRLSETSRSSFRQERAANRDIFGFYTRRVGRMVLHGDLGESPSLRRPIAQLLRERLPVTAEVMALGVAGGWALAFALALPSVLCRSVVVRGFVGLSQQLLMCFPAAALALLVFDFNGPVRALAAFIVCPRVFEYLRSVLLGAYTQPHIVTAHAKGLGEAAVLVRHVMPCVAPQLIATAGVSVSIAFGAAIPLEALCDLPGMGQLAWMAATSRDLPLLVTITLLVIALTQICSAISDAAGLRER